MSSQEVVGESMNRFAIDAAGQESEPRVQASAQLVSGLDGVGERQHPSTVIRLTEQEPLNATGDHLSLPTAGTGNDNECTSVAVDGRLLL